MTDIIPKDQIAIMLKNLLTVIDSIEKNINAIYEVDLSLTANTLSSMFKSATDIGHRKNVESLKLNKEENQKLINNLKSHITQVTQQTNLEEADKTPKITKEAIQNICMLYSQLIGRLKNDEKWSQEIGNSIEENIFEIEKYLKKLDDWAKKSGITSSKLKTSFEKGIKDASEQIKAKPNLRTAKANYYFFLYLRNAIIKHNKDKSKLDYIDDNLKEIAFSGFNVLIKEMDSNPDESKIEEFAKDAVAYVQRLKDF